MKRMLFPATVLVTVGLLFACGGSMSPTQVANGIPMSLTIGASISARNGTFSLTSLSPLPFRAIPSTAALVASPFSHL